ncbi:hypothetical protein BDF19DRAFT_414692 [Syncephalis fuscata]|nr:hypothetical protein BDF19DRAFT_414692 [Syncephalis fuscata]
MATHTTAAATAATADDIMTASSSNSSSSNDRRRRRHPKHNSVRRSVGAVMSRIKGLIKNPRQPQESNSELDTIEKYLSQTVSRNEINNNNNNATNDLSSSPPPPTCSMSSAINPLSLSSRIRRQRSSPHSHSLSGSTTPTATNDTATYGEVSQDHEQQQRRQRAFSVGMPLLRRISLRSKANDQMTNDKTSHTPIIRNSSFSSSAVVNPATQPKYSGLSAASSVTSVSLDNTSDTGIESEEIITDPPMQRVSEGEEDEDIVLRASTTYGEAWYAEDKSDDRSSTSLTTIAADVARERRRASSVATATSRYHPSINSIDMLSTSPIKVSFLRLDTDPIERATVEYEATLDDDDDDDDDFGYVPDEQISPLSETSDTYLSSHDHDLHTINATTSSSSFIEDLCHPTNYLGIVAMRNLASHDSALASSDDGDMGTHFIYRNNSPVRDSTTEGK